MLPKENRLKKKKDFEKALRQGKGFKTDFLRLGVLENHLGISRFGFIISKKISKKAAVRNKIRRRLQELIRTRLPEIKKGKDIILLVNPGLENRNFSQIKESLEGLFKKAKIIHL